MTAVRDDVDASAPAVEAPADAVEPRRASTRLMRPFRPWSGQARLRPLWYVELLLILIGDRVYEMTRNMVPTNRSLAEGHARALERLEDTLHINFGTSLNRIVAAEEWIAQVMNYYYATLHFVVTVSLLVWLYIARPLYYRRFRTVLAITTFIALAGFYLYPLAPPRLMPQFDYVDTVVAYRTWGSWADPTIAAHSNQYAAMPSLHTAWALWCALVVFTLARRTWIKVLALSYPIATATVIVGTANHFVLDALGGAAVFGAALAAERGLRQWRQFRALRRITAVDSPPHVETVPAIAHPRAAQASRVPAPEQL